ITGCLQKGEARSDYILTDVNATPSPAGTSGSTSSTDAVGKEQMRLAKRAYSLSGDRDTLEPLVRKPVRGSGMLAARPDLSKDRDLDTTKIDQGDLAKVDVSSVDTISDHCASQTKK